MGIVNETGCNQYSQLEQISRRIKPEKKRQVLKMSIERLNKDYVTFTHETPKDLNYKTLEMLYNESGSDDNKVYTIWGAYINTGHYGKQSLLVTDDCYVNLPKHLNEDVEIIRKHTEVIEQINKGKAGFKIYCYYNKKYKKACFSVNWVTVDQG